jgi:hypothetical protein
MKLVLRFVTIALFAVVGSSALLAQSNPLFGTWKLNVTKSKLDPGPGPKSLTRTVVAQGDGVKYSFEGVASDGKPLASPSNLTAKTIPFRAQCQVGPTPFPPSALTPTLMRRL